MLVDVVILDRHCEIQFLVSMPVCLVKVMTARPNEVFQYY
jgi:hypothetical protein